MAPAETAPYKWIVIAGGFASFIMSFGIGANDVANAFATSVGSGCVADRPAWPRACPPTVLSAAGTPLFVAPLVLAPRSTLHLWQAVCIAAVFEFSGSVLVGASVTETIRSGITDTAYFVDIPAVFMLGMFCALIGAGAWVLIATRLALPVSTTHAISTSPPPRRAPRPVPRRRRAHAAAAASVPSLRPASQSAPSSASRSWPPAGPPWTGSRSP